MENNLNEHEVHNDEPESFVPETNMYLLASEVMNEFGFRTKQELREALYKAFQVCFTLHIPVQLHFKKIFITGSQFLEEDWLMTDMGSYLLLVNGNPYNPKVAAAQLHFIRQQKTGDNAQ
jgi:hypothetical protein